MTLIFVIILGLYITSILHSDFLKANTYLDYISNSLGVEVEVAEKEMEVAEDTDTDTITTDFDDLL